MHPGTGWVVNGRVWGWAGKGRVNIQAGRTIQSILLRTDPLTYTPSLSHIHTQSHSLTHFFSDDSGCLRDAWRSVWVAIESVHDYPCMHAWGGEEGRVSKFTGVK